MNIQSGLARFAKSHKSFRQALEAMLVKEALTIPIEGVWTAKDIMGHLTAWEKLFLQPLQSLAAGGVFIPEIIIDHDDFNMRQSASRQTMSVDELIIESDAVRADILKTISMLTEIQCQQIYPAPWGGQESLIHQLDGLRWHADEHAKSLQRWMSQLTESKSSG